MEKKKLSNRRNGYTQKMRVGGQKLFLRTGEYSDGSLGEIFINMSKTGSLLNALLDCFCISTSIALQHGCPLDDLVDKFVFAKFDPSGFVQDHEHIKKAESIIDAVFRDLAINYLGREDLKHESKPEA